MTQFRSFIQLFWIACCAVSLMAQTRLLLGQPLELCWLDGFVFGGTVFGYYFTHPIKSHRMLAWSMGLLGGACFLMEFVVASDKNGLEWVGLAPAILWLAYYGFQKPGNAGLRGRSLAKPLTIALTWAWVTVLLPSPMAQWPDLLFVLFGRAAFIFALALAYDLGDVAYDQQQGLSTLAGTLGTKRTLALIYKSLVVAGLCASINVYLNLYGPVQALGLFSSLIISGIWLQYVLQKKAWESWYKPLIDGLMVLQFLLVLLFSF
jgi:4-hydroxybenzoate polyprenyltransferase